MAARLIRVLCGALLVSALVSCGGGGTGEKDGGKDAEPALRRFAYIAGESGAVEAYLVDDNTGVLTHRGSFSAAGSWFLSLAVDPQGKFLYVPDPGLHQVSSQAIDQTSGALTPVAGSGVTIEGFSGAAIHLHPSGAFLYAVGHRSPTEAAPFTIVPIAVDRATGRLSLVVGGAVKVPDLVTDLVSDLVIEPTGTYLYAIELTRIHGYRINAADGTLSVLSGSPWNVGAIWARYGAVDPGGRFLYVSDDVQSRLSGYAINRDTGALSVIPGAPFEDTADSRPFGLCTDTAGRFVFAVHRSSEEVSVYSIEQSRGTLTRMSPAAGPGRIASSNVAVHPNNRFVYRTGGWGVTAYALDASTGTLTAVPGGWTSSDKILWAMVFAQLPASR